MTVKFTNTEFRYTKDKQAEPAGSGQEAAGEIKETFETCFKRSIGSEPGYAGECSAEAQNRPVC